ncbi:hypothetical protein C0Z18_24300 [Trinickia dabaoshanensis]|uniref:DUF4148 domain-containing protein n=1 Tax=Trinickia dabaoshanensis TaxID=564714 RepID=A0A2N7VG44_9BURK|nr:DUF4148 domain-containing protein [Trinickia dabaoshanensis]PMS16122.1 hypothetical protein C0Z18_24300 [Trinickia dabaoshanensis]
MKSLIQSVVIAAAFAAPVAAFAQSNAPVTRAQVKAELVQFAQAGGRVNFSNDPYYPADAQLAQARVNAQNSNNQGIGGVQAGSSASGASAKADGAKSIFFGI